MAIVPCPPLYRDRTASSGQSWGSPFRVWGLRGACGGRWMLRWRRLRMCRGGLSVGYRADGTGPGDVNGLRQESPLHPLAILSLSLSDALAPSPAGPFL